MKIIIPRSITEKKEQIKYLVENKSEIISLKKSVDKQTDPFVFNYAEKEANKSFQYRNEDNLSAGIIKRAIIGNTYGWMDSHDDVHMEGTFNKSIQENKNKILHLHDHIRQLDAKVGKFEDIIEQKMLWSDLGVNIAGETTSVIGLSNIYKSYNETIYNQYLNKEIDQHSVGMRYVNIFFAVNDPEYKEEYAAWLKYSPFVANIQKAEAQGYFFAVTEAKLVEISAVIAGSNELTGTIEPSNDTQQNSKSRENHSDSEKFVSYFKENFKL